MYLTPLDWPRFDALRRQITEGNDAELERLIAEGPAWRDPEASVVLESVGSNMQVVPGLEVRHGMIARPALYASRGVEFCRGLEDADRDALFFSLSATSEPLELPVSLEEMLGLFASAWRGGPYPAGAASQRVPEALIRAFGGLEHGIRTIEPADVVVASEQLGDLHVEPDALGPWRDGVDPEGELDRLLRSCLDDLSLFYARAANKAWAIGLVI